MEKKSHPDKYRGLYEKFIVVRKDGKSAYGEKHCQCPYFVLDLKHDPYAPAALHAYANACRDDFPGLSSDLKKQAGNPSPGVQGEALARALEEVAKVARSLEKLGVRITDEQADDLREHFAKLAPEGSPYPVRFFPSGAYYARCGKRVKLEPGTWDIRRGYSERGEVIEFGQGVRGRVYLDFIRATDGALSPLPSMDDITEADRGEKREPGPWDLVKREVGMESPEQAPAAPSVPGSATEDERFAELLSLMRCWTSGLPRDDAPDLGALRLGLRAAGFLGVPVGGLEALEPKTFTKHQEGQMRAGKLTPWEMMAESRTLEAAEALRVEAVNRGIVAPRSSVTDSVRAAETISAMALWELLAKSPPGAEVLAEVDGAHRRVPFATRRIIGVRGESGAIVLHLGADR